MILRKIVCEWGGLKYIANKIAPCLREQGAMNIPISKTITRWETDQLHSRLYIFCYFYKDKGRYVQEFSL